MTLGEHQRRFAQHIADLIHHINARGYACTFGDAYRDPRLHGEIGQKKGYGAANSNHKRRLAVDLNLFTPDGAYVTGDVEWRQFGDYFEALDPLNRWGGRYDDANHLERVPNGWR